MKKLRHLMRKEQQMLSAALRRSTRELSPPQPKPQDVDPQRLQWEYMMLWLL
jgi:hypothetical protein